MALGTGEPEIAEDVFAKVSALGILLANRRLGARLRHAGIRVVNTSRIAWRSRRWKPTWRCSGAGELKDRSVP